MRFQDDSISQLSHESQEDIPLVSNTISAQDAHDHNLNLWQESETQQSTQTRFIPRTEATPGGQTGFRPAFKMRQHSRLSPPPLKRLRGASAETLVAGSRRAR